MIFRKEQIVMVKKIALFQFILFSICSYSQNQSVNTARAISLKVLQTRLISQCHNNRTLYPSNILSIANLKWVDGIIIDKERQDIILFGPLNENSPPLNLDDFVVACRVRQGKYMDPTVRYILPGVNGSSPKMLNGAACTIMPRPSSINEVNKVFTSMMNSGKLDESKLRNCCEVPQDAIVFNVDTNSHFCKIMVEADYFMKRITDGSAKLSLDGFRSFVDIASDKMTQPGILKNRFWFVSDTTFYTSHSSTAIFNKVNVRLETEEMFMNSSGLQSSGQKNPIANEYAVQFSNYFDDISKKELLYSELKSLYLFASLAKIVDSVWNSMSCINELCNNYKCNKETIIRHPIGIANVVRSTRFIIPTCGGVDADPILKSKPISEKKGAIIDLVSSSILDSRPHQPDSLYWDFSIDLNYSSCISNISQ
jgi:Protein of unknown function (DUF1598).